MLSSKTTFLHETESNVKCHGKLKRFTDGSWELLAATKPIFGADGWELSDKWDTEKRPQTGKKQTADLDRARRRAAASVRDIARCTPFRWFVTLTFSPDKVDRYDPAGLLKTMRSWLDNRVRRKGLAYILVPELHKDGAVHFHGFFNDADICIISSGTYKLDGQKKPRKPRSNAELEKWLAACAKPVYNIADWGYGFSTAIEIYGDYNAAIGYCCKYIGKQTDKIGGRWYYSGGVLGRPQIDFVDVDYWIIADNPEAYCFSLDSAGLSFAMLRGCADDGHDRGVFASNSTPRKID